jgi:hypothetical protein
MARVAALFDYVSAQESAEEKAG